MATSPDLELLHLIAIDLFHLHAQILFHFVPSHKQSRLLLYSPMEMTEMLAISPSLFNRKRISLHPHYFIHLRRRSLTLFYHIESCYVGGRILPVSVGVRRSCSFGGRLARALLVVVDPALSAVVFFSFLLLLPLVVRFFSSSSSSHCCDKVFNIDLTTRKVGSRKPKALQ